MNNITFNTQTANVQQIYKHLLLCDKNFIPPLSTSVNLLDYAKKINEKAVSFEAWDEDKLIGLIAIYCNDFENKKAFITNVSTDIAYSGKGIATKLLQNCMDFVLLKGFKQILLEVNCKNENAIKLYKKKKFVIIDKKKELFIMEFKV